MYTEENEFDYNEYLAENENGDKNNSGFNKAAVKIVLIIVCLLIIIFLVFKVKNSFQKRKDDDTNKIPESSEVDNSLAFSNNLAVLKGIAEDYFFKKGNYPKEKGDIVKISINTLISEGMIDKVVDGKGKACAYDLSYISLTRNPKDYKLEIYLSCSSISDKIIYYYDLDFNCLTCKGEDYKSPTDDEDDSEEQEDQDNALVCSDFSDWTTEKKDDTNLESETRVVVTVSKDNTTYGPWSIYTENPIFATDTLEVETMPVTKFQTTYTPWSAWSTSRPSDKAGREIEDKSESSTSYHESCKTVEVTKKRNRWDSNAIRCVYNGINNITCTYKEKSCTNVPTTKTTTYYHYRDTISQSQEATYYRSRVINKDVKYIYSVPENEIPNGYQKVEGSETVQYRYREKCVVK